MKILILSLFVLVMVKSDLPVHCEFPSVKGKWKFQLTKDTYEKTVTKGCKYHEKPPMEITTEMNIELQSPNVAIDLDSGEQGTFTLIYDQALEITIERKKMVAYFDYIRHGIYVTSYCNRTLTGWFHETDHKEGEFPTKWGCFYGSLIENAENRNPINVYMIKERKELTIPTPEEINKINKYAKTWKAKKYSDEFYKKLNANMYQSSNPVFKPYKSEESPLFKIDMTQFPKELDWRNYNGKNYVSPVRSQGSCGSCYCFGSLATFEARARINTNLNWKPIFSPQEAIDCSFLNYNQGCDGGFPEALGLYSSAYGLIYEEQRPYNGWVDECGYIGPDPSNRTFTKDIHYVGGYYGACNEELMIAELAL